MKRSFLVWLISFATTSLVIMCLIFGYFTAKNGIAKYIDVRDNKTDVPYVDGSPENFGIRLNLPKKEGFYFYLDFQNREIVVSPIEANGADNERSEKYNVDLSYDLFGEMIDKAGGIDVTDGDEDIRITGVTAADLLKEDPENAKMVMPAFVSAICSKGLSQSDLLYILDNCENSDVSLVDLFPYKDILAEMLENVRSET
ncbi:MAG: hypothetical protein J5766_02055 [Clostridia bacterium]|nr:hypothetical protein [Clostridia bacterium]